MGSSCGSRQTTIMRFTTSAPFLPLPDNIRTIMASCSRLKVIE
ncbi:MAG: hypothetical protein QW837_03755 [Conexivisphaerales archaeon]